MSARKVLLLGKPRLCESSEEANEEELEPLKPVVADLHDTLMHFVNNGEPDVLLLLPKSA